MSISNTGQKFGFTLAEILITLSIIGVIASMTIPSLVQDVQDAQYKTAWKKVYADLNQAAKMIMLSNAGSLKGVFVGSDGSTRSMMMRDEFLKNMNYIKSCNSGQNFGTGNCWHSMTNFKFLNNTAISGWPNETPGAVLNNGMLLNFWVDSSSCNAYAGLPASFCGRCGWIAVDVNGFKGPNIVGKDIFEVHVVSKGVIPRGSNGDNETCTGNGMGCSALYLYRN